MGGEYLPVVALFLVVCLEAGDNPGQAWWPLHKGHKERVALSGEDTGSGGGTECGHCVVSAGE